jgi:hypothetical protein
MLPWLNILSSLALSFYVCDRFADLFNCWWFATAPIGRDESGAFDHSGLSLGLHNLSVWYKLIDKTYYGAYISIVG